MPAGKGMHLSIQNIQSTDHQNPPHHHCKRQRQVLQGCKCHGAGIQKTPLWPMCHRSLLFAKFTALLPCLTWTFCHIYFFYRMAQHGSNPQRDSASFTMEPSSQTPATKTQKTWTVVCSHPHDCKITEESLRSALFIPNVPALCRELLRRFPSLPELYFQLLTKTASLLMLW